ncbi:P-loop containing nucleoside triphosphate hydrolase protein [Amylocystis lapponica]|nr:P-loop containing nucleoside triphosphate hydrolase protein [Amylocystis lapponica]
MSPSPADDKAAALLNNARAAATAAHKYSSLQTRERVVEAFKKACGGKVPYEWQLDVTEALLLGLDSIVIAGTGAGKTMPFAMPLMLEENKNKMIIIVSPLNELEADQAVRFRAMGLEATAANGEVYTQQLHEEIVSRKHRLILTSPEMLADHPLFSKLMRSPEFTKDILSIVVDEAHCIAQWGESFRKKYIELNKLRSYLPIHVPILATSATMPPHVLTDVKTTLCFPESRTYIRNLGNDRPNITPIVCRMQGAAKDLNAINFVVDEARAGRPLLPTIVFFNTRDLTMQGCRHLRALLPEDVPHDQIDFFNSMRSRGTRREVMARFRLGIIKILCSTEAAAMGMDILAIIRVVQFMTPSSLSVWLQRYGRAGRAGQLAMVVLLVEPSVYEVKKPPNRLAQKRRRADDSDDEELVEVEEDDDEPEEEESAGDDNEQAEQGAVDDKACRLPVDGANPPPAYKKKVEMGLREWIQAPDCRRAVSDTYFNNPPRTHALTAPCCDLCVLKKVAADPQLLTPDEAAVFAFIKHINTRVQAPDVSENSRAAELSPAPSATAPPSAPVQTGDGSVSENTTLRTPARPSNKRLGERRGQRRKDCVTALQAWRMRCWTTHYRHCIWGAETFLPDQMVNQLARLARIRTLSDIQQEFPTWGFATRHGPELLALLACKDAAHWAVVDAEQEERKQARAIETERKRVKREEERRATKHAEAERRRTTRAFKEEQIEAAMSGTMSFGAPGLQVPYPQYNPQPIAPLYAPSHYPPGGSVALC